MKTCPSNEEIDKMWTVLSTFIQNSPKRCILHMAHVETEDLDPPTASTMMHIATKLMQSEGKQICKKCKLILIQPKYIDNKVRFAKDLFRLYFSDMPLKVSDREEKIQNIILEYKE